MKRTGWFVFVVFCFTFLTAVNSAFTAPMPLAENGILDVAAWDFETAGPIGLDGKWEFYWGELHRPEDFHKQSKPVLTGYIDAPGYWDGYEVAGKAITGIGFATLRLRVKNLPSHALIAFDIPLMHTAYQLWGNGELLAANGVVGKSKETSQPQFLPRNPVLTGTASELELVLQISNFHHNNGGIWQTLKMGLEKDISYIEQGHTAFDLFLLGAIFVMALYHFALFALRRKDGTTMFFGLFCLVVSFRISIHGSTIFSVLFPDASWEILVKLDYFTLYFGLAFYCAFIQSLYRFEFIRTILNVIVFCSAAFVLFTIVVPATVFTTYLTYFQVIMGFSCFYTLSVLVLAVYRKRDGARVMLGGCMIIVIALANDILYMREIVHTGNLMGLGLLIMIVSQSFVLSSMFSKALYLVEDLSIHLDQMVKERTAAIKDLLDNTGQGFFSFAGDYKVQKYTSRATFDFFGKEIENEDALTLMFPDSAEEKEKLLSLIFEDAGNLALVEEMLPSEVKRNEKIYSVDYHWIESRENLAGRIMIVMTDITTQRKLEQQLKTDEEKNKMIVKIAVDRHGFIDFLNEVNSCLGQVKSILSAAASDVDVKELFRHFHTIKGGMASYFFMDVAGKAHEIENLLESARGDNALPAEDLVHSVGKETDQLVAILHDTLKGLDQIVPKQLIEAGFQPYFRIPESKVTELEDILKDHFGSIPNLKQAIKGLKKQPIRNIMKKYASDAETLASNLGKKINISLQGEEIEIVHSPFKPMFSSLIHIVRNCVDHGIEEPQTRRAFQKPEVGNLRIKIDADDSEVTIVISDDGAGIDAAVIKAKAQEKGIIGSKQVDSMSESEAVKLIFAPGFSTNEIVTDLSGRGVGMDAVADEVSKLNGTIDVRTTPGAGTQFLIKVPNL